MVNKLLPINLGRGRGGEEAQVYGEEEHGGAANRVPNTDLWPATETRCL